MIVSSPHISESQQHLLVHEGTDARGENVDGVELDDGESVVRDKQLNISHFCFSH